LITRSVHPLPTLGVGMVYGVGTGSSLVHDP
jgi:hypothetical protein